MKSVLLIYRGRVFDTEIKPRLEQFKNDNITLVTENKLTRNLVNHLIRDYTQKINLFTIDEFLDDTIITKFMKFDVIVGNPPYQKEVGPNKTEPIWDTIVERCFVYLKTDGVLSLIHPNGWRNITGRFKKIQKLLLSKQIQYLKMHDVNCGMKTFGVSTSYDYYILKNQPPTEKTHIRFDDGREGFYDISKMNFIPNSNMETINSLISKNGEETVNVLYSSSDYEIRYSYMNKEKTDEFKYPCVYSIVGDNEPTFYYSNKKDKGHFGIPKLILGNGANPKCFIDYTGEFGMTQFAYGIVDDIQNLEKIKRVLESNEFQKINLATKFVSTAGNPLAYPRIISLFRKDFWKEFIND